MKTILALLFSTSLVACVVDDNDVDVETAELAENPDVLPDEAVGDTTNVKPGDVAENPDDVTGSVPATVVGSTHVVVGNQATEDLDLVRGDQGVSANTTAEQAREDLGLNFGNPAHVTGEVVGGTLDGKGPVFSRGVAIKREQ